MGHTLFVTQTVWHVGILFTLAVDYFLMTSTCASKFKEYTEHDYIAVCMYTVDRSLALFKLQECICVPLKLLYIPVGLQFMYICYDTDINGTHP